MFGYLPVPRGAGFKLERFNFLTTNREEDFAGTDFKGGRVDRNKIKTLFRPSDVLVGADGAIYVSDWYDPRVGGHSDQDETLSGAIYRVAPKGFKPQIPAFDLETTDGQISALKSPAVNVRNLGFTRLKASGAGAFPAVQSLLADSNPAIAARAIFLLPHLGEDGVALTKKILSGEDARQRLVALRALRRSGKDILPLAAKLAKDPDAAVRRELATSLRDVPFEAAKPLLLDLAKGFDGVDRTYLEALGIACKGKEAESYAAIKATIGDADPAKWSPAFAKIAWRLHPAEAAEDLSRRAQAPGLADSDKKAAVVALAFIAAEAGAEQMLSLIHI